ncbi:MAG: glycosyltransferase family 4 protein [Treponema sp.]|nr:glycosyltransferase family 4 protein [Treponema sp.]
MICALQHIFINSTISVISEKYSERFSGSGINIADHLNKLSAANMENRNIDLILVYANKKNFAGRAIFERKLFKISSEFDIFFNCSMNLFSFGAKKNIAIIHFPPYHKTDSAFVKRFPFTRRFALEKDIRFASGYDLFIPNSLYTMEWLDKLWHVDKNRIKMIYPPVPLIQSSTAKKDNYIIICSRIEPSKKIETLVSAFLSSGFLNEKGKLFIAGAVIDENLHYIEKIKNMTKNTNVVLVENPGRHVIEEYYGRSKIFWHAKGYGIDENADPFQLEHFGMTTVEAMSAGCVPVVINRGGQKEIVEQDVTGFLWDTPGELIEKTVFLLENDEKFNAMSKAAQKSSKRFSPQSFTGQLRDVLNAES